MGENEKIEVKRSNETITENTFTRTGYTFLGWATTSTGSKVYDDG